jgi:LacI family transcriptional regulator
MRKSAKPIRPGAPAFKIGVVAPEQSAVTRQMLSGIFDYRGRRSDWELHHVHADETFEELRQFKNVFDAVIAQPSLPAQERVLRRLKIPVVLMGTQMRGVPGVVADEEAIGRMAFDALRGIGAKRFAFCGVHQAEFSERRGDAFEAAAIRAGLPYRRYYGTVYPHMDRDPHAARPFQEWMRHLRVPTGLFVAVSEYALEILHQCRQLGRKVPDELSILAVDDDEILCEFQYPTISAIDQNAYGIGRAAAAMLDKILKGQTVPPNAVKVAPRGVVHRGSTQAIHAAQPWLRKAMELIHVHVEEGLRVDDIVRQISVSRRTLECAFARELGQSVHDAIVAARVEHAKRLLEDTDLKPFQIALRCGFPYASGLSRSFSSTVGMTPAQYRNQFGNRRMA